MKLARYHGTHAMSNASSPTMLSYRMLDHTISKKNCFASKIATCVFSLRGKRLKIRTDTTLDPCDMECNCCLHCTSENSLHPTLLQMLMQQHYTYLLRQQVLPWSKTLLVVDDSTAGAPFGVPLLALSL